MKKIFRSISAIALSVLLSSCVSGDLWGDAEDAESAAGGAEKKQEKTEPSAGTASQLSDNEKVAISEKYLDELLASVKTNDFNLYFTNFTKEHKDKISQSDFKQRNNLLMEQCGEYQSREFMGVLKKQIFDVYLWKARFSKLPNDDILLRMFVMEDEGALKVYAFNVKPF
jgi:hypothetical protein